jgi:hypothetical protein
MSGGPWRNAIFSVTPFASMSVRGVGDPLRIPFPCIPFPLAAVVLYPMALSGFLLLFLRLHRRRALAAPSFLPRS